VIKKMNFSRKKQKQTNFKLVKKSPNNLNNFIFDSILKRYYQYKLGYILMTRFA